MVANENSGERKIKRVKVREWEREGSGKEEDLPRPSSFSPRSPAACHTDPLTEGLEQAKFGSHPYPISNRTLDLKTVLNGYGWLPNFTQGTKTTGP